MKKLLLLLMTKMAASFDAVVEAKEARIFNLRQHQSHRLLKKDKVDWEEFAVEIQTNQTNSTEDGGVGEVDWNAFAESISSAAQTSAPPTVAEPKTAIPTKTPTHQPSKQPTPSPSPVPTQPPTSQAISGKTPTTQPTEFNFSFSFGDSVMSIVPLPVFRIEFVATTNNNRRLRQDEILTGDAENTFIGIISNQILSNLQENQGRQLISVELNIEDKRENHFPQMIMFSYDIGGYVSFAGDEDALPPLPSSNDLLEDILEMLNTESFEGALKSFDNSGILSIDDVVVSALGPATASIQVVDSTGAISDSDSIEEGSDSNVTPTVIALVTAFALTMSLIGFITVRKLREPEDGSFGPVTKTYQNIRKRFHHVTPMGNNRQYDQFESPQGSVDSVFGAIQDSDSEYPSVTNVDVRQIHAQQSSGDGTSFLPSHLTDNAFVYESDTGSERCQQSLDLLYSDTDSYFGSSVATSIISSGIRPRMSSKDYVYSDTDSSLRSGSELEYKEMAKKHTHGSNTHGIANVNHLLLYTDQPSDSEITDAESALHEVVADESNNGQPFENDFELTEDLFARLDELENKLADTECQFANENNIGTREEEEDSAVQIRDSSDTGVLASETLGIIPRNQLRPTPPPSEDELDGDAIDSSKDSPLLGNLSFESDADADDELLFQGSFSTIGSDFDSRP